MYRSTRAKIGLDTIPAPLYVVIQVWFIASRLHPAGDIRAGFLIPGIC